MALHRAGYAVMSQEETLPGLRWVDSGGYEQADGPDMAVSGPTFGRLWSLLGWCVVPVHEVLGRREVMFGRLVVVRILRAKVCLMPLRASSVDVFPS